MRLLAPALSLLLSSSLLAQYYTAPVDAKAMLAGLKDLKDKQATSSKSQLAQTITDFSNAAASDGAALEFYLEAIRVTQFVGQPHEQTAFREWKKKEADKLSPPAIRACLRYTTISLQRAAGATDPQIFPVVLAYAQDAESMIGAISSQEIARQSVSANIFAKWYNLGEQMSGLDNWETSPANVDGIYEKFLLPFMRKNRDPRVIQYWDKKIADETANAANASAEFSTDRFNQTRRPELLWSRAEDQIAIDQRNEGLTAMYNIVKSFPTHPSAGKWIDELQGLLTAPVGTGTSGTAAAASAVGGTARAQ
jgi:hypothetical protein